MRLSTTNENTPSKGIDWCGAREIRMKGDPAFISMHILAVEWKAQSTGYYHSIA